MLARPRPRLIAPAFRLVRLRSTNAAPLIKVKNVPAPGSGHIRVLELNRPEARNAISKALLAALRAEIHDVHAQYTPEGDENPIVPGLTGTDAEIGPTRALILASACDKSFCAGADLKERRGFTQEETAQFLDNLRSTFNSLANLPIPTISVISSVAFGGGLELALCTHFRVMSHTAFVGLPETKLGIIPGAGGTYRLPALIGPSRARQIILTGRQVPAAVAYAFGLADHIVEVPEWKGQLRKTDWRRQLKESGFKGHMSEEDWETHLEDTDMEGHMDSFKHSDADLAVLARNAREITLSEALEFATEICQGGPIATRAALQAISGAREEVENAMYQRVVNTEDRNEGLQAFKEKRPPVYKGR